MGETRPVINAICSTRRRVGWHEVLLALLAMGATGALWIKVGSTAVSWAALGVAIAYAGALCMTAPGSRLRLATNYGILWSGYASVSDIVTILGIPVQSASLLNADRLLFGETPSVMLSKGWSVPMLEIFSAAYLGYQVHLHWALIGAFFHSAAWRDDLSRWVFRAFAIGFAGYLFFPAASPCLAFPELFNEPLLGGLVTRFNDWVNASFAARYDAFPSLHTLVTLALLAFDWRWYRMRFWVMAAPSLIMLLSTLTLRLHYAVDLLASLVLFLVVWWRCSKPQYDTTNA